MTRARRSRSTLGPALRRSGRPRRRTPLDFGNRRILTGLRPLSTANRRPAPPGPRTVAVAEGRAAAHSMARRHQGNLRPGPGCAGSARLPRQRPRPPLHDSSPRRAARRGPSLPLPKRPASSPQSAASGYGSSGGRLTAVCSGGSGLHDGTDLRRWPPPLTVRCEPSTTRSCELARSEVGARPGSPSTQAGSCSTANKRHRRVLSSRGRTPTPLRPTHHAGSRDGRLTADGQRRRPRHRRASPRGHAPPEHAAVSRPSRDPQHGAAE